MSNPRFTLEMEGGLARLTLNAPARANAVNQPTIEAMAGALAKLAGALGLRGLVLTGAGERVFCGGADLADLAGHTATRAAAYNYDADWDRVTEMLARLPCLTVARINGACVGGGLSLVLACDLRLAAEHAFFEYPTLRNGVVPSPVDTERLVRLVGPARAKYLWLAGQRISSREALAWGLVERVMPLAELDAAVAGLFAGVLTAGPALAAATKRMIEGGYRDAVEVDRLYRAVYDGEEMIHDEHEEELPPG